MKKKTAYQFAILGIFICLASVPLTLGLLGSLSTAGRGFRSIYLEGLAIICDQAGAEMSAYNLRYAAHKIDYDLVQIEIPFSSDDEMKTLLTEAARIEPRILAWGHELECQWVKGEEVGFYKINVPKNEEQGLRTKINELQRVAAAKRQAQ
jgi:hypothetical protein